MLVSIQRTCREQLHVDRSKPFILAPSKTDVLDYFLFYSRSSCGLFISLITCPIYLRSVFYLCPRSSSSPRYQLLLWCFDVRVPLRRSPVYPVSPRTTYRILNHNLRNSRAARGTPLRPPRKLSARILLPLQTFDN